MPISAFLRGLRGGGVAAPRHRSRRLAHAPPPRALPSALRRGIRSGSVVNGKTRSPRYLPVVPGPVHLPGARREAGSEAAERRGDDCAIAP